MSTLQEIEKTLTDTGADLTPDQVAAFASVIYALDATYIVVILSDSLNTCSISCFGGFGAMKEFLREELNGVNCMVVEGITVPPIVVSGNLTTGESMEYTPPSVFEDNKYLLLHKNKIGDVVLLLDLSFKRAI